MGTWLGKTATDIAAAVRADKVSPRAVVERHLERIAEADPALGAFQVVRREAALAEADELARRDDRSALPLAGVPIAIKDSVPVRGEPMRLGSAATDAGPSPDDHEVVRRLREAGAVIVGLTAVPELCVYGTTDSVYGITRNPWNPARTPGGSSGGSAAAVAAGMVPVAHGNDGMGSIRIPAAACGLVGVKPGFGVVPAGIGATDWFGLAENGTLATTVADAALMLAVMADRPDLAEPAPPSAALRVAVSTRCPVLGVPVDQEFIAAAHDIGAALAEGGHRVRADDPPYPTSVALGGLAMWFAGAAADAEALDARQLEPRTRRHAAAGRLARRAGLVRPGLRESFRSRLRPFFDRTDLLVTPTLARTPIAAKRWGRRGWLANVSANARYAPFAAPWNVAGWPAVSIPAGVHSDGLPLAVQLVAPPGGEALLLAAARQVEQARPWLRHSPRSGIPEQPQARQDV